MACCRHVRCAGRGGAPWSSGTPTGKLLEHRRVSRPLPSGRRCSMPSRGTMSPRRRRSPTRGSTARFPPWAPRGWTLTGLPLARSWSRSWTWRQGRARLVASSSSTSRLLACPRSPRCPLLGLPAQARSRGLAPRPNHQPKAWWLHLRVKPGQHSVARTGMLVKRHGRKKRRRRKARSPSLRTCRPAGATLRLRGELPSVAT
mmetsp:Transcript_10826/g.29455  ORF Transcript_10826/g.29455 Transcript_10826/m.29455 type:complete len:202 (-) Transcript_10826:130-735(-)